MRRGITVPRHPEAMARICTWLDGRRRDTWWPDTVSRSEQRTGSVRQTGPGRPSWCYGTPGLARALQLAALATADTARRHAAETAMDACLGDARQLSQLVGSSVCHGWAGLLHTTWRMALDAGPDSPLHGRLPHLRSRLGQSLKLHGRPAATGLLEGATGIRLVQHTATSTTPPATRWDACLLLDG
jgi:hypothetical protein